LWLSVAGWGYCPSVVVGGWVGRLGPDALRACRSLVPPPAVPPACLSGDFFGFFHFLLAFLSHRWYNKYGFWCVCVGGGRFRPPCVPVSRGAAFPSVVVSPRCACPLSLALGLVRVGVPRWAARLFRFLPVAARRFRRSSSPRLFLPWPSRSFFSRFFALFA